MKTITQKMKFRESILRYAEKNGVTEASIKYNVNRQYVYRWKNRYDGTLGSLADRSHRPKSHPNQHTEEEIKLIKDMRRRNPNAGLVVFWVKLTQRGYTRSITGLYRMLRRLGETPVKLPNPKYVPKPYEAMTYPGQRVQIDASMSRPVVLLLLMIIDPINIINIPLLTSSLAFVLSKALMRFPLILQLFSSTICSRLSAFL